MRFLTFALLVAAQPLSAGGPPEPVFQMPPLPGPGEPIPPSLFSGASLAPPLQPFAFLVGSCWSATYVGGAVDTHCFTPMLGGHFVRDRHRLSRGGYAGETLYRWDAEARRIRWDYYSSEGWVLVGTAAGTDRGLAFEFDAASQAGHAPMPTRVAWRVDGPNAYVVTTEVREKDVWHAQPDSPRFQRIGPPPAD
jgi:hypothetical protein